MISLWSWQTRDFSLEEGIVNHTLSEFDKTHRGYRKSCKELSKRIGTDQFIWCDTHDGTTWQNRVKWGLKVPEHRVRLYCSITWHWILSRNGGENVQCVPPEKLFDLSRKFFYRDEFCNTFHDGWRNKTTEELWDILFVDKVQGTCTHALLQFPVVSEWVIYDPRDEQKK